MGTQAEERATVMAILIVVSFVAISCQDDSSESETTTDTTTDTISHSICINQTEDGAVCKDCCDCIEGTADDRKACRDECATHDFTGNSDFISHEAPSELGEAGDYSVCVDTGSEADCKTCCDGGSVGLVCGDFQFCRTACVDEYR